MMTHVPVKLLTKAEKIGLYARAAYDYLNIEAIFSDETANFVTPCEPRSGEPLEIKIRVGARNVDGVFISFSDAKYTERMTLGASDEMYDYYSFHTQLAGKPLRYGFVIIKNGRSYYYNKRGVSDKQDKGFDFTVIPDFTTPNWAKGCVMYQIYVDRFFNGDRANDVVNNEYEYLGRAAKRIEDWDDPVAPDDICNFYGGDLRGVMDKLGYLKSLGVEAIYLNPVFVSPSNHKYDAQDYDCIDPHYGVLAEDGGDQLYFERFDNKYATKYMKRTTDKQNLEASNALFAQFTALAHENGIRVILDGVFNHCGAFSKWLDRENFYSGKGYPNGAYKDEKSPYHDYFCWQGGKWPNNDNYEGWWGHSNHPKLNYENSRELYEYIMHIGAKWVSPPYNADGWRLDVAADLGRTLEFNHQFWRDFRRAVKEANPDAVILAEHYGDPSDWLTGDQWDTVMNYDAFMEPITWFLTGMEKHSEEFNAELLNNAEAFRASMASHTARHSYQTLFTAMNQLSNHDHSRFLTRTNMTPGRLHTSGFRAAAENVNKAVLMEAVTFQMTWPGAPTVYYGDEAGVPGWTDPDNRRTFPWGREDRDLTVFHKEIIALRKKYSALRNGSLVYLRLDYGLLVYGRWDRNCAAVVALNNNEEEKQVPVPAWKIGVKDGALTRKIMTRGGVSGCDTSEELYTVKNGLLEIVLPPFSSLVLIK
ncbi:MAG: glycoside hydrolase family 13 protein [Clostridiales bacterium]|jgi:alpha-glucosidase|nr:glycoside hydrolase family 13 protein [Clostridiales bacterium]